MMTNNKAWQAVVNPANFAPVSSMENKLIAVKQNGGKKQVSVKIKTVTPKRYSFDDNGGGYEGL